MKKILSIVVTSLSIIGGIWVIIQIYTWATESKIDISATIDVSDFSIPARIADQFSDFHFNNKDSLQKVNYVYNFKFFLEPVEKYGVLNIRNTGDKEIKDIQVINIPMFYEFSDSEGLFHSGLSEGKVKIGNLQATESINLLLWGRRINEDNIRITYPDGVLTPDKYFKASGFIAKLAWMQKTFGFLGFMYLLITISLIGYSVYRIIKFDVFKKKPKLS